MPIDEIASLSNEKHEDSLSDDFGEQWATPTTETSGYHASSSHLWAALADSSLANEADSGPASRPIRDGAVLFLEESRALAEPEFVRSVYEVGLLCGAVDTLPS
ncbi:hypothetical protein SADUNF_SadunfMtG0008400 (mitochondrion) [Salix dunnii]|uniref:Uncharacterized protein n=1 Tax=Salix dunnii TaxID=1413687 RepID=A0A835J0Z7_9ROSI|nr:hypothetical protein SADUNF_SadunfMtG0008400 [Salix dunnii]